MTTFLAGAALGLGIGYAARRHDRQIHARRMDELRAAFHAESTTLAALMRRNGLER